MARTAPLSAAANAVIFAIYTRDGRLQLQQHGFFSPQGEPLQDPGKLSMNGGLMESADGPHELNRELLKELGITLRNATYTPVGNIHDAERSCTNHIYRVDCHDTFTVVIGTVEWKSIEWVLKALLNPESIGRAFFWKEDLEAAIAAGMLTPISVSILKAFPSLMPPPRP